MMRPKHRFPNSRQAAHDREQRAESHQARPTPWKLFLWTGRWPNHHLRAQHALSSRFCLHTSVCSPPSHHPHSFTHCSNYTRSTPSGSAMGALP
jgi:hypothetical protein